MVKIKKNLFSRIAFFATLLAFTVVILGAYTRLKNAGLGCPDWPGCYGQLIVPESQTAIASAKALYPNQTIEPTKAWAEMVHRYFAGTLVLLIGTLAILSVKYRKKDLLVRDMALANSPDHVVPRLVRGIQKTKNEHQPGYRGQAAVRRVAQVCPHPIKIPLLLVGCIFFQAMLGMWTVTWQLLPLVVMGHLLGGMTIASLLWWLTLDTGQRVTIPPAHSLDYLRPWVIAGVVIVFLQIFLGGWTSANYASIICPDFPYCQGQLFPKFNFSEAFNFFSPIGRNYQGGVLGGTARVTIQMTHRYGAFITFTYLTLLGCYVLFSNKTSALKNTMGMVFIFLGTQVFLGILNIASQLYLPIAVTHNGVALLLLLSMITLLFQVVADPMKAKKPLFTPHIKSNHLGETI